MIDRENVIEHLKKIAEYFRKRRSNLSFASKAENHFWELQNAASEAAELLKAQEPRVMSLDEVHEMAWDYCYLEEEVIKDKVLQIYSGKYRIKCITWPSIASCTLTFGDEAYGKRWRCWTSRPTDEQRAATPWSEPPKEET